MENESTQNPYCGNNDDFTTLNDNNQLWIIGINSFLLAWFACNMALGIYVCVWHMIPLKVTGKLVWGFYLFAFLVTISRMIQVVTILIDPNQ